MKITVKINKKKLSYSADQKPKDISSILKVIAGVVSEAKRL